MASFARGPTSCRRWTTSSPGIWPGTEGISSDVDLGKAEPVQLAFDGIRQRRRRRRNPRGKRGGASEAGEVERDDVVVVAQCLVDRLPADSGFSHPVEQDQWLARSGSVMGEVVGGGRRQAGLDDVSSLRRAA